MRGFFVPLLLFALVACGGGGGGGGGGSAPTTQPNPGTGQPNPPNPPNPPPVVTPDPAVVAARQATLDCQYKSGRGRENINTGDGGAESCLTQAFQGETTLSTRTKRTIYRTVSRTIPNVGQISYRTYESGIFIIDNNGLSGELHRSVGNNPGNFFITYHLDPSKASLGNSQATHGTQVSRVADALLPKDARTLAKKGYHGVYINKDQPRVTEFRTIYKLLPTNGVVSIAYGLNLSTHGIRKSDIVKGDGSPNGPYLFLPTGNTGDSRVPGGLDAQIPYQDSTIRGSRGQVQKRIADETGRVRFIYGLNDAQTDRFRTFGCKGVEKWCVGFPHNYFVNGTKYQGSSVSSSGGAIAAITMIWEYLPAAATIDKAMEVFDACAVLIGGDTKPSADRGKGRFDLWCAANETAKEVAKANGQTSGAGAGAFLNDFYGRQLGKITLPAVSHGRLAVAPQGDNRSFAYNPQGAVAYTPAPPSARAFLPVTGSKEDKTRLGFVSETTGESGVAVAGAHSGLRWQVATTRFSSEDFFGARGHNNFAFGRSENLRLMATLHPVSQVRLSAWQTHSTVRGRGALLRGLSGREVGVQSALRFTLANDTSFSLSGYAARFAGGKVCYHGATCAPINHGTPTYGTTLTLTIPLKTPRF